MKRHIILAILILILPTLCIAESYLGISARYSTEIREANCNQAFIKIADFMHISRSQIVDFDLKNKTKKENLRALHKSLTDSQKKVESCLIGYIQNENYSDDNTINSALSSLSIVVIDIEGWLYSRNHLIPPKERLIDKYQTCIKNISELKI